jgi:hypothetical protein
MRTESVSISCDDCVLNGTSACKDCVVTFLLGPPAGVGIVVDVAEARAVRVSCVVTAPRRLSRSADGLHPGHQ